MKQNHNIHVFSQIKSQECIYNVSDVKDNHETVSLKIKNCVDVKYDFH